MAKKPKAKPKKKTTARRDENQSAFAVVQHVIQKTEKKPTRR
jgi:hypothetical protein